MKKIITILLVLISSIAYSQDIYVTRKVLSANTTTTNYIMGSLIVDGPLLSNLSDTVHAYAIPKYKGMIVYKQSDSTTYTNTGTYWRSIPRPFPVELPLYVDVDGILKVDTTGLRGTIIYTFPQSARGDTVVNRAAPGSILYAETDSNITSFNKFLFNSSTGLLLGKDLTLDTARVSANEADSKAIYFKGFGTAGVSQTASIQLDGGGSSGGGLRLTADGTILLTSATSNLVIPIITSSLADMQFYTNSASNGFRFQNNGVQTSGTLLSILGNGSNRLSIDITGNVGINNSVPQGILDIASTTSTIIIPRMTKTQRDAIVTKVAGMIVYQTDNTPGLRTYNGTSWMRYNETAD